MASSAANIGIGIGVALGIIVFLGIVFVLVGFSTSKSRQRDLEEEMERRRELLRERHMMEQQQWRQRRLRDVVLILIERGEASEGIPLAFQMPNHAEVGARRQLRARRNTDEEQQRLQDQMRAESEAFHGIDDEMRRVMNMPLDQLLADGRPADAEPAPDVMQLLLDGQEVRAASSDEDGGDDASYVTDSDAPDEQPQQSQQQWRPGGDERSGPLGAGAGPGTAGGGESSDSTGNETPSSNVLSARDEAALRKLHEARTRTNRRRKTAEEVYGPGIPYLRNPNNELFHELAADVGKSPMLAKNWSGTPSKKSFFSPLTPFRKKKKSAFTGLSPQPTSAYDDAQVMSPHSTRVKATTGVSERGSEPF